MRETWVPSLGQEDQEKGNGYLFQYSCLENSMDRGAWRATVHGVAKSQTRLSNQQFHFHFYIQTNCFIPIFPIPPNNPNKCTVMISILQMKIWRLKETIKLHLTCRVSKNCNSFINQILVPQKWHPTLVEGSWEETESKPCFQWILYFPEIFRWCLPTCCPVFSLSSISGGPSKMLQQLKCPCPAALDTISNLMIR